MKRIFRLLWRGFALRQICNFFDDDAHNIVSKRGWIKLNENEKNI